MVENPLRAWFHRDVPNLLQALRRGAVEDSGCNSYHLSDEDDEDAPRLPKKPTWTPITLALLFGEAEKPRKRKPSARVLAQEARLMETLAEMEARADAAEDAVPDDGAIEIDSGEDYQ
ncbi:hypothetical protein C8R46DRAFT_1037810 [Mycena filopes]|nr:hypothetical protein C8R46DRAFT_1037810 [Mycena filopes]